MDGIIVVDDRLSERWFGPYDNTSDANLRELIWPADSKNKVIEGVESPAEVAERVMPVFADAREAFPEYDIVYVTHGDVAQIALRAIRNQNPSFHRRLRPPVANAELRRLR